MSRRGETLQVSQPPPGSRPVHLLVDSTGLKLCGPKKLRLKVNEAKSAVARPEERKFLGFSISNDGSERRIAPKALDKFKTQVRDMTRRTRGISLQQLIEDLTPYLIGWRGYFGFCQTPRVLTNLEAWIPTHSFDFIRSEYARLGLRSPICGHLGARVAADPLRQASWRRASANCI
jgi:Group II intron, maturase-specific domain